MAITARKAQAVAVSLHDRIWSSSPGATEYVVDHGGQVYIVATGSGDPPYAYSADQVYDWLERTEGGSPSDAGRGWPGDFADAVKASGDPALAELVHKETGVLICAPGTSTPVMK